LKNPIHLPFDTTSLPAYSGAPFHPGEKRLLDRVFHLQENHTTVRRELLAGLTTFMTMAYVVVVNPRILSEAGMPVDGVLFATCISAAIATLIMGLWANYPIALAPGMSLNAYFTYSIVLGRGVPWQTAPRVVFLSGLLFCILSLAASGLILIAILMARRVGSAILIGIVAITLAGIPLGLSHWPGHFFSLPHPSGAFLKLDLRAATSIGLGELIFVFFFVDLFDNVGTLVGVFEEGGFLRDGKLPRASRALLADAFGTMFGALTGTSTVTSYIESAAGVAAGARTGLGNVVIAALFLVAMFCAPLVVAIPAYATAPALILVGA